MLTEIYSFNKLGVEQPEHIQMPTAIKGNDRIVFVFQRKKHGRFILFLGFHRSMVLNEDEQKATQLMREALEEVLAEYK